MSLKCLTCRDHLLDEDEGDICNPCSDRRMYTTAGGTLPSTVELPVWPNKHNNRIALEGCDRCPCGCKYWENDRCIDCGLDVLEARVEL